MTNDYKIRRGMVFWYDLDDNIDKNNVPPLIVKGKNNQCDQYKDYRQYGMRHWLVVSNDLGNKSAPTCNIVPMTSSSNKSQLPTHVQFSYNNEQLAILCEQPMTVNSISLQQYAFKLPHDIMAQVTRALAIQNSIIPPYPSSLNKFRIQGSISAICSEIEFAICDNMKHNDIIDLQSLIPQIKHRLQIFADI